jgi:hypothetical protein
VLIQCLGAVLSSAFPAFSSNRRSAAEVEKTASAVLRKQRGWVKNVSKQRVEEAIDKVGGWKKRAL